jgi:hypothetical protein
MTGQRQHERGSQSYGSDSALCRREIFQTVSYLRSDVLPRTCLLTQNGAGTIGLFVASRNETSLANPKLLDLPRAWLSAP